MDCSIVYSGARLQELIPLQSQFELKPVQSVEEAMDQQWLTDADVYLLGPLDPNPVKEIQKLTTADKHLSIILLALPEQIKAIKQSLQFAPFVGKNTLVVGINPELDLVPICKAAVQRTKQKRSFHKLSLQPKSVAPTGKKIVPEQLGIFLAHAPIGAILLNDVYRVITYNEQAKRFFPTLSITDADLKHLFSPEVETMVKRFIQDGHHPESRKELAIQKKIMEVTSSELYNEEGQKLFLLLFHDITEQRQEQSRIQSILEALPQMAWTADAAGNTNYFTQGWYHYTGQSATEAFGTGWLVAVQDEDRIKLVEPWQQAIDTGKPFQQAARYKNASGDYRWHLVRATPIRNNSAEITMWVGTCTDIHDQILLTEELERKVTERTKLLQISNSELEQFAHISSHDLQEPLRKIRTFAELVKDNAYANLDPASQKYIDKISSTAERMSASLKALLNFTKLHRDEKFSMVDLNEVVALVLVDLELAVSQKAAVIHLDHLPKVKAIPIQMQQLFYNLLNNALKFTRPGVAPEVTISCRRIFGEEVQQQLQLSRYKDYYEIAVKDNGVGFDQQHAEKIFTIFQRLHNKTEFEGTGIGLSLVKKVVQNHKGDIRAFSQPGHETTFKFWLPA